MNKKYLILIIFLVSNIFAVDKLLLKEFNFAKKLYYDREYFLSYYQFNRYIFLYNESSNLSKDLLYKYKYSYLYSIKILINAKKNLDALTYLIKLDHYGKNLKVDDNFLFEKYLLKFKINYLLKYYSSCISIYNELKTKNFNFNEIGFFINKNKFYKKIKFKYLDNLELLNLLVQIKVGRVDKLKNIIFSKASNFSNIKLINELNLVANDKNIYIGKKYRPTIAGILSIIPGLGQFYNKRYADSILSFFYNLTLISLTTISYLNSNSDNYLGANILATIAGSFYLSNIYNAVNTARQNNYLLEIRYRENLRKKIKNVIVKYNFIY